MKLKSFFLIIIFQFFFAGTSLHAQNITKDVNGGGVTFTQTKSTEFILDFKPDKYRMVTTVKNDVTYSKIVFNGTIKTNKKGWAELPLLSVAVQLPPDKNISIEVVNTEYIDLPLSYPLLPSKGILYRNQDPSAIPYEIDPNSIIDSWYPGKLFTKTDPYIIRDVRGTSIQVAPFQYNPVKKILRVCTNISLRITENNTTPLNPLMKSGSKTAQEMPGIYSSAFINYHPDHSKWNGELAEFGEILAIYTHRDSAAIQPWITWKKEKGYKVHQVQVATGTNVKNIIQTQYNSNPAILYVQLTGDWADIISDTGGHQGSPVDPMLGCVAGGDNYYDLIIGRFSADDTSDVNTQVNKTITYEKFPEIGGLWYSKGLGIGGDDGPADDPGELTDHDQVDVIKHNKLLPFTYTIVNEAYGDATPSSTIAGFVNQGLSIINYCDHGNYDLWVTGDFDNTDVSNLTNGNKLPFSFSVACLIGDFSWSGGDCLAEAFMNKKNGGAIAEWMASISQPWYPPYRGQDYANDMVIQGYDYTTQAGDGISTNYGKTIFGSITFNAGMLMITESSAQDDWDTYESWTVFGDATLQVRTQSPMPIALSNDSVYPGMFTTNVTVNGNPFKGAIVSLYKAGDPQPFSAISDSAGNVMISHPFSLGDSVKLTVTGFNLATYQHTQVVAMPLAPDCGFYADFTTITASLPVHFYDQSLHQPASWNWNFQAGTPLASTNVNPVIVYYTPGTYDVSLKVSNIVGADSLTKNAYITVLPITTPPLIDFTADKTNIFVGEHVNFTDLTILQPASWSWTFAGGSPAASSLQHPHNIVYDSAGTYDVTLVSANFVGADTAVKTGYIHVLPVPYCEAMSLNCGYEYISRVQVITIDNPTLCQNYSDYTSISADMQKGSSYPINVTNGNHWDGDSIGCWIDWNIDGDFNDANERIAMTYSNPFGIGTIGVPAFAKTGTTRMRIRLVYQEPLLPCGSSNYGEVEDYSVNVLNTVNVESLIRDNKVNIYPNPTSGTFTIEVNNEKREPLGIEIMQTNGAVIMNKCVNDPAPGFVCRISLAAYAKGIYFARIFCGSEVYIRKIVVQ